METLVPTVAPIFLGHQNGISVMNLEHDPNILENLCVPGLEICRLPKIPCEVVDCKVLCAIVENNVRQTFCEYF